MADVELPIIHLPGGLHIVVGGFVEIDDSAPDAVTLTYAGGGKRVFDKAQSEAFLVAVGLKQPALVQPARTGIFGGPRRN